MKTFEVESVKSVKTRTLVKAVSASAAKDAVKNGCVSAESFVTSQSVSNTVTDAKEV